MTTMFKFFFNHFVLYALCKKTTFSPAYSPLNISLIDFCLVYVGL